MVLPPESHLYYHGLLTIPIHTFPTLLYTLLPTSTVLPYMDGRG